MINNDDGHIVGKVVGKQCGQQTCMLMIVICWLSVHDTSAYIVNT